MEDEAPSKQPRRDRWKELLERSGASATNPASEDKSSRGRPRRAVTTLSELPLFADERSLSEAVLGHGKYTHWRAVVTLLEGRGFPKIDGLMGGRYTRAVRAFFDREYCIHGPTQVSAPHQPAKLGAAHGRKRRP